jgi:arginase
MGVAHMVGEPGVAEDLARIGPRFPLMADERILLFGYETNPPEIGVLERRSMPRYPAASVRGRAEEAASEALIEDSAEQFVVHFDVDVIDFVDFPIADVPQINVGLTFEEAMACLTALAASPGTRCESRVRGARGHRVQPRPRRRRWRTRRDVRGGADERPRGDRSVA